MRNRKPAAVPFEPNWKLTPTEALVVTLTLSLNEHIPHWQGCSDEQLEAVARDVLVHVKNERDRIFSEDD